MAKTVKFEDGTSVTLDIPSDTPAAEAFKLANAILRKHENVQRQLNKGVQASAKEREPIKRAKNVFEREQNDNYWKYMNRLQKKYGDESTKWKSVSPGFLPRNTWQYDEKELTKRAARDQLGFTPKEPGAFATLGKLGRDLYVGSRQVLPKDLGGLSEDEIKKYKEEDLIWSAADHPLSSEAGALALTAIPSLSTMPFLYTQLGKAVGSQTLKGLGETAARRQAGMGNFPKTNAALGAAYGGALPHGWDADTTEAMYTRLANAMTAGVSNYALAQFMHAYPDAHRTTQYVRDRNKLQEHLPVKVREHVFDVYGSSQAKNKFKQYVGQKSGIGDRATAADATVINDLRKSTNAVLEDMVGTAKPKPIGAKMKDIMDKFFETYKASKNIMDQAYADIPDTGKFIVTNKGPFNKFKKNLVEEIKRNNLSIEGPVQQAITELNKIGKKGKSITFPEIRQLITKINKAQQRVFNDETKKDLRPAITKLKSDVNDYIENNLWRDVGARGGQPGAIDPAVQAWRNANAIARKHYQKFHGIDVLDEAIDEFNKSGKYGIDPTDISEDIFIGFTNKLDKSTQPRVNMLNKFRTALGDIPDFNVDRALKEEAINALRGGGVAGADDVDTLLNSVTNNVLTGQHSKLFEPQGYGGQTGLFNAKEFSQLKELADIRRRYNDPHTGIGSTTRDTTQIPNNLLGRTIQDTVLNEHGPFGVQWAGKLGETIRSLSPEGLRNLAGKRMDDRIIRRYTAGLMGNYDPQIPAPLVAPLATQLGNNPTVGEMTNPWFQDNKDVANYLLQSYDAFDKLFK